jgi:hypothetical protein
MTLDTPETLAALHRTNTVARVRKLSINEIVRESRNASSLEALRTEIERIVAELEATERNAISK